MNNLVHIGKFRELLKDYRISEAGKKVLADSRLVLCSAAAATGRNTIIRELTKTGKYYFIVSDTTRKPRDNDGKLERSGVEYWFRSEEQMLEAIQSGQMLEAELIHNQQVSGMSLREINKAKQLDKIAITDADRGGVDPIVKVKPDTICLFFLPPNFDEWQNRLSIRGEMEPAEARRRLETAVFEFKNALAKPYYWFVVNDDFQKTVAYVDRIITNREPDSSIQQQGRELAKQLLEQTVQKLTEN